jgi:hypothetical protein
MLSALTDDAQTTLGSTVSGDTVDLSDVRLRGSFVNTDEIEALLDHSERLTR